MEATALAQNGLIPGMGSFELRFVQTRTGEGIVFPVEQESAQLVGPGLLVFLPEELQFAQQVLVAQRV